MTVGLSQERVEQTVREDAVGLGLGGVGWRLADKAVYNQPPKTAQTIIIVRAIVLFLLNLLKLIGLILLIVAVWMGGKKDETP